MNKQRSIPLKQTPQGFIDRPFFVARRLLSRSKFTVSKYEPTPPLEENKPNRNHDGNFGGRTAIRGSMEVFKKDNKGQWQPFASLNAGNTEKITSIGYSPDGSYFVTGSRLHAHTMNLSYMLRVWTNISETWQSSEIYKRDTSPYSKPTSIISHSPYSDYFVEIFIDRPKVELSVWGIDNQGRWGIATLKRFMWTVDYASAINHSPCGRCFALGLPNNTIQVWSKNDLGFWQTPEIIEDDTNEIQALQFSPDGIFFFSKSHQWQRNPYDVWQSKSVEKTDQAEEVIQKSASEITKMKIG